MAVKTLSGGTLYDGLGNPGVIGNIVIQDDRIQAVGPGVAPRGDVIDVTGLAVSPGFVDTHSHCDLTGISDRQVSPKIRQGVTTDLLGQDGFSEAPIKAADVDQWRTHLAGLNDDPDLEWTWRSFADYFRLLNGSAINFACMVGHSTVRLHSMGMTDRPPTREELTRMQILVGDALQNGACGFSTGLIYTPAVYCETGELIELGRVVARHQSFMVYHMRFEGERVLDGIQEVVTVGVVTGSSQHISHFKARGREAWGNSAKMVEAINQARADGVDLTADQYPYTAGSTMLGALLPPWVHSRGVDGLNAWLRDDDMSNQIQQEIEGGRSDWESSIAASGWDSIQIAGVRTDANQWTVGKRIPEVAAGWNIDNYAAMVRLLLEENHAVSMILHMMDEEDVRTLLVQPWLMHATDGLMGGTPHPRTYGTYPRVLGHYTRDLKLMPIEEAIRKMTSLPAWRCGLANRGVLQPGAYADVAVFNPDTVIDTSSYAEPVQFPIGVEHVFVNGAHAVADSRETGNFGGRALRREVPAPGTSPATYGS